tara:strand:+ start:119 stop:277 length:159 start_codon:yes stop_codon:yes gene_type:complete
LRQNPWPLSSAIAGKGASATGNVLPLSASPQRVETAVLEFVARIDPFPFARR